MKRSMVFEEGVAPFEWGVPPWLCPVFFEDHLLPLVLLGNTNSWFACVNLHVPDITRLRITCCPSLYRTLLVYSAHIVHQDVQDVHQEWFQGLGCNCLQWHSCTKNCTPRLCIPSAGCRFILWSVDTAQNQHTDVGVNVSLVCFLPGVSINSSPFQVCPVHDYDYSVPRHAYGVFRWKPVSCLRWGWYL